MGGVKRGVNEVERSEGLLDALDPSEGLAARACVSEMIWLGFTYVL